MDELISRTALLEEIKGLADDRLQEVLARQPAIDAIPVEWINAYVEDNFWARCDVCKMVEAWHLYVKKNIK